MSHGFPLCHKKSNTRNCVANEPATNEPGDKRTQPLETPQGKEQMSRTRIAKSVQKKEQQMSELQKIRIKLKAYDHALLDQSAAKIVETAKKTGAEVSGPIPLPTEKEIITILRAVHKYKDSREQFEQRTHKRLIDITSATARTTDALTKLEMPAGVSIEIKL